VDLPLDMSSPTRIQSKRLPAKQPNRPHFIPEWAERGGFGSQQALANALEADKSLVSRWYNGSSPTKPYQKKLGKLFGCAPEAIFEHPDKWWLTHFLSGKTPDEVGRVKQMLEAAFPTGNKGSE
jgi:hypothetical protein